MTVEDRLLKLLAQVKELAQQYRQITGKPLRLISASLVTIAMGLSLACATSAPSPTPSPLPTIPSPERTLTRAPSPTPIRQRLTETLTTQQKQQAIGAITGKQGALEASISQDGKRLSLSLVVRPETTQDNAQELGDNFVRLVKIFGPEALPGKGIGLGTFDYVITVAYADGTTIAQGVKESNSTGITW